MHQLRNEGPQLAILATRRVLRHLARLHAQGDAIAIITARICNTRYGVLMPSGEQTALPATLGAALRRLRERSGRNVREVSDVMGWSSSKLSRIETSSSGVNSADLARLLDFYEAADDERDHLGSLSRRPTRRLGWLSAALPYEYERFTELEAQAAHISTYAAVVVAGLLQTEEYASAVINASPPAEEQFAKIRIERRMVRQAIFGRQPPVSLNAVIDEAVLLRPIGGDDVVRRQMIRLQELNSRSEITIRVLPLEVGAHPALSGPFTILDFPGEAGIDPHVFCDGLTGGVLRSSGDDVDLYRTCFAALEDLTLSAEKSAQVFAAIAEGRRGM